MLQDATRVARRREERERANGQESSFNKPSTVCVCVCVCVWKDELAKEPWPGQMLGEAP